MKKPAKLLFIIMILSGFLFAQKTYAETLDYDLIYLDPEKSSSTESILVEHYFSVPYSYETNEIERGENYQIIQQGDVKLLRLYSAPIFTGVDYKEKIQKEIVPYSTFTPDLPLSRFFISSANAQTTTSTNPSVDCEIRSAHATTNYCALDSLWLGNADGTIRSLLKFVIPNGISGTNTSSSLNIAYANEKTGSPVVNVHEVTQAFTSGVTWNTYNGSNNWATAGGDYNTDIIDTLSNPGTGADKSIDTFYITGSEATNSKTLNSGETYYFMLKVNDEGSQQIKYYSSNNSLGATAPYLELIFTDETSTSSTSTATTTNATINEFGFVLFFSVIIFFLFFLAFKHL